MDLKEQVAVVTGASRGIGRAICLALAERGTTVVGCARNLAQLETLAGEVKEREFVGSVVPHVLDVTDRAACDRTIEETAERHGRLDILVNNAGITRDGLLASMDDEQFDSVIDANLRSVFHLTRAATRPMIRARRGRIINISSVAGVMGNPGQCNYAASKAGVIGFTKAVAKELARRNITCNVVAPGFIETDMTDALPEKAREAVLPLIPLRRFGQAQEIAAVVAFLASDASAYMTGQVLVVDGGLCM